MDLRRSKLRPFPIRQLELLNGRLIQTRASQQRLPHLMAYGTPGKAMTYSGNDFMLLKDICDRLNTS